MPAVAVCGQELSLAGISQTEFKQPGPGDDLGPASLDGRCGRELGKVRISPRGTLAYTAIGVQGI